MKQLIALWVVSGWGALLCAFEYMRTTDPINLVPFALFFVAYLIISVFVALLRPAVH